MEGPLRIVTRIVDQSLARCDRLGIAHADFYRAMVEERKANSKDGLLALVRRTFERLQRGHN